MIEFFAAGVVVLTCANLLHWMVRRKPWNPVVRLPSGRWHHVFVAWIAAVMVLAVLSLVDLVRGDVFIATGAAFTIGVNITSIWLREAERVVSG